MTILASAGERDGPLPAFVAVIYWPQFPGTIQGPDGRAFGWTGPRAFYAFAADREQAMYLARAEATPGAVVRAIAQIRPVVGVSWLRAWQACQQGTAPGGALAGVMVAGVDSARLAPPAAPPTRTPGRIGTLGAILAGAGVGR